MPVKYIGREIPYSGKRLFDILCRLKNFGEGRLVYRQSFTRYPEVCFYKITEVKPNMADPNHEKTRESRSLRRIGLVSGERIFRGKNSGVSKIDTAWKADWRLVPKTEEKDYLNRIDGGLPPTVLPETVDYPPLMKYMFEQQAIRANKPLTEKPTFKVVIPQTKYRNYAFKESISNV